MKYAIWGVSGGESEDVFWNFVEIAIALVENIQPDNFSITKKKTETYNSAFFFLSNDRFNYDNPGNCSPPVSSSIFSRIVAVDLL